MKSALADRLSGSLKGEQGAPETWGKGRADQGVSGLLALLPAREGRCSLDCV